MKLRDLLSISLRGLQAHKTRSLLTILGIVIGITAIILVVSMGRGAEELILDQVRGLGSQTIIIEPGREPTGPAEFAEIFTDSLKERDLAALASPANVRGVRDATPAITRVGVASFLGETKRTNIFGGAPSIVDILDLKPERGLFFTDEDIKGRRRVAVLGSKVKEELFGLSDAVGEDIKIEGVNFKVVGVIAERGRVGVIDVDNIVSIPYTTAQQYITGTKHFNVIFVRAESDNIVPRVASEIEITLRELHNIDDPDKDDFHVTTQADVAERVGTITAILTALLVSIATISLVVGGVGIMNIMLVSVTERTREIGLRKAVGATNQDILNQFLVESAVLTAIGGALGAVFGALFAFVLAVVLSSFVLSGWHFVFSFPAAIIGIIVSALVGLVFGWYPARIASEKSPIEALRYE